MFSTKHIRNYPNSNKRRSFFSHEIKNKLRQLVSPRHVPAKIISVGDIPRTRSGKITELAVRDVIHGKKIKNIEALSNPEALDLFKDLAELNN